jgi:hypothetical protein
MPYRKHKPDWEWLLGGMLFAGILWLLIIVLSQR